MDVTKVAEVCRRPDGTSRGTAILVAMCFAVLSYSLMQTMLVPTITTLQHELRTTAALTAWAVLSAPLLASAVLTPLIGKLGDHHGKRRILIGVLVVYLVGTLGALVSWNVGLLIAFRAVQGVSLGLLPLAFGVLRESLPADRVASGLALASGLVGGSAGLGLVCGGLLVDYVSWRWLFAVGAVLVAVTLGLVLRFVPESRERGGGRLDVPGVLLLATSLTALLLALTQGPALGWTSPWVWGLFAVAVLAFAVFLPVEKRTATPLIDPELLVHRRILPTHLTAVALGAAQFVLFVLLPKFAETPRAGVVDYGFGVSVTAVGLIMLPGTLLVLPGSWLAGRIDTRAGPRVPLATGLGCVAAGAAALALWHGKIWQLVVFYAVASVGFGLVMAVLPRLVNAAVAPGQIATANGVNTVARTAGGAVGSQLGAAILASMPIADSTIPSDTAYGFAFGAAALVALIGVGLAKGIAGEARLGLPARRG
ncbi:MFS transporter [Amycolatopsis sp. NPDC058986]|uniref:MFS transporter n=1 Tax=unclassified Amycolatopsis TaxID=2618356 RepID=UPI00366B224A